MNFKEALIKAQEIDEMLESIDTGSEKFKSVRLYVIAFISSSTTVKTKELANLLLK